MSRMVSVWLPALPIERLKLMNRALVKKLRPGSHGHVGLAELINELVAGFERRQRRRRLLDYLKKKDQGRYESLIGKLSLRR